jgi:hypothetical protein
MTAPSDFKKTLGYQRLGIDLKGKSLYNEFVVRAGRKALPKPGLENAMISTVTTSTVSTVTTAAIYGSVALIGILVLLTLLIQKEVTTAGSSSRLKRLSKALNIAIVPLLIAFVLIVVTKVMEVLR